MDSHYYILCLFAKGKTKNRKGCEAKITCHICNVTRIATCGSPTITNIFNHTQNIANFKIHKVSQNTLRLTRNRNLVLFGASHFAFEYVSQTSSQIFTKVSGVRRIASCDVH
jgi:hypothetical protein